MSVYILDSARTPIGSFLGQLSTVSAPSLAANCIESITSRHKDVVKNIGEVYLGQVVQAGTGQAPARQASLFANLPESVECTTVNKVCGSGMQSVILGAKAITLKECECVLAGGMENMSLAPHLMSSSRRGVKFGQSVLKDSMQFDGLWDVYSDRPMGNCAEECVNKYQFSREMQDEFAINSFKKAQKAISDGLIKAEISSVKVRGKKGDIIVSEDEGPFKAKFEKIPTLKPAFDKEGTITAANASTINDGAAVLLLGGEKFKNDAKFKIIAYAGHAQHPTWFTTAPALAMKNCAQKANIQLDEVDLFEINEAFAAVVMATMRDLELKEEKVNIFGGAISYGHPIGCSGAKILVTLMNAMETKNKKLGMASICIGGGEALAILIEKLV